MIEDIGPPLVDVRHVDRPDLHAHACDEQSLWENMR